MTIQIYLLGVCISAAAWFILIKFRQEGFYIPMPRKFDGNLLDPLNHKNVDWSLLMLGWFLMAVLWAPRLGITGPVLYFGLVYRNRLLDLEPYSRQ
ncbi:hypothetical protein P1A145kb_p190 [Pectobacterium phage DU_PP_I]|nr:hypothetical protein P1A145kb_p190 [Pectobacterium phage DU_PP_I]ATS93907.1 hypothetical protein P12B145kb_p191 [Pectobacterium phage DU_PP_IV]